MYKKLTSGFTLVEIMVVVVIISILLAIVYANVGDSTAQSRDAKRQADLRALQSAVEAYKFDNGVYPEGCNGAGNWSGQQGTDHECSGVNREYIEGIAPKYITSLPVDPKSQSGDAGYVYTVNADRTVYKVMARNTVESEDVDYDHSFMSCEATNNSSGFCDNVASNSNNKPTHCQENNAQFQASYAVWGGYADPRDWTGANGTPDDERVERMTEDVICK